MEQNTVATMPATDGDKQTDGKGWKIATIIAFIVAVCGIGFGGFELYLNTRKSSIDTSTLFNLDKDSSLGKKLYEQIKDITAAGGCEQYHPLYDLSEDKYIIKYEDLSNSVKFEIIAQEIPEIANLKNDGDKTIVSGETMEEALDSIFGDHDSTARDLFGFVGYSEESIGTQHIQLLDYDIEQTENNNYIVSLKRRLMLLCDAPRYSSYYEYIGLLNITNGQIEDDNQMALIVLEKKTIDFMNEDDGEKSDGYYGVLFKRKQDNEDFFWVGAYYLGK